MKRILATLSLGLLCIAAASAKEIKTLTVTTEPPMHCQGCENRIKNQLKFEKGIKKIETSVEEQRITITYDADKTTPQHLLESLEQINYTPTIVKNQD